MAGANQSGDVDSASALAGQRFAIATTELERLEMELLLLAIFRHHGFDFRSYAPASLHRRIRRHMENAHVPTISRLTELILHDPSALQRLLHDLSVNVTAISCAGANAPTATCCAMRRVIVVVFPEPAPARMHTGPRTASAARRCSGLRPSSGSTASR